MRNSKRFLTNLSAAALLLAIAGSGDARTRKGDALLREGHKAEQRKEWDKALELYEKAVGEDPGDLSYQISARRVRFQAGQAHIDLGLKLRRDGKLAEALAEFQHAYAIDPSSAIAEQELKRTMDAIERTKKSQGKPEERGLTAAELARKQELERIARFQAPPELKPLSSAPINLRMSNQPPKVLYETVGKLAGVNVVFDADFAQDPGARKNISVELNNSTLDDALNYLATMTKTFWKPLSSNAIFVSADNTQKRRDFEDMAVKVFYLTNITTPQELTEIATTFRTVADIRKLFQVNSLNAIIVKGTPDQIELCDKLLHDLDKPRAEVVVDVLIMEVNRVKTHNYGASIAQATSSGLQAGLNTPILFTPRNPVLLGGSNSSSGSTTTGTTTGTTTTNQQLLNLLGLSGTTGLTGATATQAQQLISLARIAKISTNDFSITLPGALLNFVMSDRNTKVLQSPQVRAASGQKASLRIGDKVPVAQGGFQPFGGSVGGFNSLYSQFQFLDVGVNMDITPTVHSSGEVTLKVMFEISNVRDHVDIGGISQPVIGQRKIEHEIRIKEGEASVLGGLMQSQDTKSINGVPGLSSIPLVKWLFSSESVEHDQGELLIALIPHIVRTQGITDMNLRAVAAGTDQNVKVTMIPLAGAPGAPPAPGTSPETAMPPVAIPGTTPVPAMQQPNPLAPPKPEPGAPAPGQPGAAVGPAPLPPGATPAQPGPQVQSVPPAAEPTMFLFRPVTLEVKSGATFTLELLVQNARELAAAPFHLKFNPQLLRLQEIKPGPLLSADGQKIIFTRNILNDTGDATVNLNRMPDAGGMSGTGTLAVFTFEAVAPGKAGVTFSELNARNAQQAEVKAAIPQAVITVK